jgi:flavin-binding protein dodecin
MSIIKVLELMSSSEKSWEDAAAQAVSEAGRTVKNIRSIYIQDHSAVVRSNKITEYRINAKVSFEVSPDLPAKTKK